MIEKFKNAKEPPVYDYLNYIRDRFVKEKQGVDMELAIELGITTKEWVIENSEALYWDREVKITQKPACRELTILEK